MSDLFLIEGEVEDPDYHPQYPNLNSHQEMQREERFHTSQEEKET